MKKSAEEIADIKARWRNQCVVGQKVVLVPYCEEHVPRYHTWMQDPWLQELTASQPMTIEEEYKNRQGWATDLHRFTFIVLDKTLPETNETNQHTTQHYAMAGDVNLFLDAEEEEEEQEQEQEQEEQKGGEEESNGEKEVSEGEPNITAAGGGTIVTGEINLMTAEERSRRKGLAGESLLLMMEWGMRQLAVQKVLAKINTNNEPSIRLFEREGFVEVGRSEIFQEVSLELDVREGTAARQRVLRAVAELQASVQPYYYNNN